MVVIMSYTIITINIRTIVPNEPAGASISFSIFSINIDLFKFDFIGYS